MIQAHRTWRRRAAPAAALVAMVLATGGCELGLHAVDRATAGGCDVWRPGCPIVVDVARGDPIRQARVDVDRPAILAAAEAAPHRRCAVFPLGCQARTIGDVVVDNYLFMF